MTEPVNESGLGSFLKSERERKGLSLEHLSKVTRLRMQYLEALEKENWDRLPSPVFIKGFIKTYTKALGLDYREVLGQFQSSIPAHDGLPKPLVPPKKKNTKKYAILIALIILVVSLLVIFLVIDPLSHFKKAGSTSIKTTEDKPVQNQVYQRETGQGEISIQDSSGSSLSPETSSGTATKSETAADETKIQSPGVETAPQGTPAVALAREITAKPAPIPIQGSDLKPVTGVKEKYVLTGYITQKTYIKIYIDNDPPIENIFTPGSYPQWRGDEGFYVLVGNAGGVEFDLNGKRIKELGKQGDVVRLRLPENFNLNLNE
jgi:cytoskeletal protein RodZ